MDQQIFDKYYINFWREELEGPNLIRDKNLIINLGRLSRGSEVLEFGSGFGRISKVLNAEDIFITGIERSEAALVEALSLNLLNCKFIHSDWLNIEIAEMFDCILFWGTTLCAGYDADIEALRIAFSHLKKDGYLLIETRHWDRTNRQFDKSSVRFFQSDILVESHFYDCVTGMQTNNELFVIGNQQFSRNYQMRRYSFPELREICLQIGFQTVEGFDENGLVLSNKSERAILRATKK